MSYPKSLTQPFRKNVLFIGAGWRCFFAPFNIALASATSDSATGPKILDLQSTGPFNESSVPSGWFDLGWIVDFKMTPQSHIGQIRSGYRGAVRAQYIGQVGEEFEFKFREIGRMQTQIATGKRCMNLLRNSVASTVGPVSGSGAQTVAMVSYSAGAGTLTVATGSGSLFSAGDYIVCDQDYSTSQYGLVGDNAQPVFQNNVTDVDYIRKNSDYVQRVVSVSSDTLTLSGPFIGGGSGTSASPNTGPTSGAKIQKIRGWVAREGGSFIMEWSAMFVMTTIDGDQIVCYYPHVSISQFRDFAAYALENVGSTTLGGYELDAVYQALAFDDPIDGETVVGYRAFYPGPTSTGAGAQDIAY